MKTGVPFNRTGTISAVAVAATKKQAAPELLRSLAWLAEALGCEHAELTCQVGIQHRTVASWRARPNAISLDDTSHKSLPNELDGLFSDQHQDDDPRVFLHRFQTSLGQTWLLMARRSLDRDEFTREERHFAYQISQPIEVVVSLWTKWEEAQRRNLWLHGLLQIIDFGVILLDIHGYIIFSNRRADLLLEEDGGLVRAQGRISASTFRDATMLQAAISYAFKTSSLEAEGASVAALVTVSRPKKTALTVAAFPIAQDDRLETDSPVALFVVDPSVDISNAVSTSCSMQGLSRTETRLATLIVTGMNIYEAASALRIQEQTARAYLRHIFTKLDVSRQADLVRVLLSSVVRLHARLDSISS